ncbi:MAG: methyltransferase domain-containing protein [Clostridiales bacterium]|nr:methyltransferase domain-containing protein [Clostridiales bacterium]
MDRGYFVTIILVVHNEKQELQICLDSIRRFGDVDNLQVVIIDNASTDGTAEWLSVQSDIAYATIEEGVTGYAEVINTAIELFGIDGDLMLMSPQFAITPGCISRMLQGLYSKAEVGAVGPVFNGDRLLNGKAVADYGTAVLLAQENDELTMKQVVGIAEYVVLIKKEVIAVVGRFDEQFTTAKSAIQDYLLRVISEKYILMSITNSMAYCMLPDKITGKYEELMEEKDNKKIKEKWGMNYFNITYNSNLIQMITHSADSEISILEVGCDCGATLIEIKNRYPNATVYGYEINEQAAKIASYVAKVEVGNLEDQAFSYEKAMFDYIIFGDVLEHLRDPAAVINYCSDYLKPDGHIIASIPNLMHVSVIKDLLAGNFTYTDTGLLDKTHIHMFTYNEIIRMFESCNYNISEIVGYCLDLKEEDRQYIQRLTDLEPRTDFFMFETFHYVVRAGKKKDKAKKIIIIEDENDILNYTAQQFVKAYRNIGYEVYRVFVSQIIDKPDNFMNILRGGVEKAIVFNNRGWLLKINDKNIWDVCEVPCINYMLDHPFYYFDTLDQAPRYGIAAYVDKKHVDYAERFNKKVSKNVFIPLAGEDASNGFYKKITDRNTTVLFAATYKYREEYGGFSDEQKEIIEELIKHPYKTLEQAIEEKIIREQPDADDIRIKHAIEENRRIDMYLKFHYRREAVARLVAAGIDVEVCGIGWETAEFYNNPHFIYHGAVSQEECLKRMRDSKIVLNVMPWFKDGIHDRVINAMLAGALCITDDSKYLSEEFVRDREYISYDLRHMEELPEIVRRMLESPDIAQQIADTARQKAYERHTWDARIRDFERDYHKMK